MGLAALYIPEENVAFAADRGAHAVRGESEAVQRPDTELVRRRSAQYGGIVDRDPRFRRLGTAPTFYRYSSTVGTRGVLYEKVRSYGPATGGSVNAAGSRARPARIASS